MRKRTFKRGFLTAAVAAIALLAACRGEQEARTLESRGGKSTSVWLAPYRAAVHTADATSDMVASFHAADAPTLAPDAIIERRHFEVYNRYRIFFDGSADAGSVLADEGEEGLRPAVVTFSARDVDQFPACSLRALRQFD